MTNQHRGEVSIHMGDATYTLRLSCNALVAMEAALQQKLPQILAAFNARDVGLTEIRAMLWAALREHHSLVTLEQAGDLLDVAGFQVVADAIGEAFVSAWPTPSAAVAAGPKGPSGTGTASSRKPRKRESPPSASGSTPPVS